MEAIFDHPISTNPILAVKNESDNVCFDDRGEDFVYHTNGEMSRVNIYPIQQMLTGKWKETNDSWYLEIFPHIKDGLQANKYCIYDAEVGKDLPYNDPLIMRKIRANEYKVYDDGQKIQLLNSALYEKIITRKKISSAQIVLGEILTEKFPENGEVTHTIIPNMKKIWEHKGDFKFSVTEEQFPEFIDILKSYNSQLFEKMDREESVIFPALTQKRGEYSSLTVDIDLRYEGLNQKRQFTNEMISSVNKIIVDALMEDFDENLNYECFKLWREYPYNDRENGVTKDGFHLEYPFIVQKIEYWRFFYKKVAAVIDSVFRKIPNLVNKSLVFDETSITGNWLTYLSAKPGRRPMTVRGDTLNGGRKIVSASVWEKLSETSRQKSICEVDLVEILAVRYGKKINTLRDPIIPQLNVLAKIDYEEKLKKRIEAVDATTGMIIGLLNIISMKHLSHAEWIKVCFGVFYYVKNSKNEIVAEDLSLLQDAFVKMSVAVNDDASYDVKATALWTANIDNGEYCEANRPCTIGTLRHYAILANEPEYQKLIGNEETTKWPSVQPEDIDYYTNARFPADTMEVYSNRYIRPLDINDFDTALIWSHVNTGKTTAVIKLVKDNPGKSVVLITFRITLAEKLYGDLIQSGFEIYNEVKGSLTHDRMIVQLDSLRRLQTFHWDIVIMDEMNLLLGHMESPLMKKYGEVISNLERVTEQAEKLIMMDAYMTPRVSTFVQHVKRKEHVEVVETEYGMQTEIRQDRVKIYKNEYIPEEQKRKVFFTPNRETLINEIKQDIVEKQKICIVSMSKKFANVIAEISKNCGAKDVVVYTGDTIKYNRASLRNVEETWKGKQVVIFTQTIVAGVSYAGEEKFDKIYMYCVPETGTWDTVIQMLNRVRDVSTREMIVYVEGCIYEPRHSDYIFSTAKIEENILAKIDSQENLMAREVFNRRVFDRRRNSFTYNVTKDWVYWVCIENHRHRLFSNRYFKFIVVKKLKDLGCEIYNLDTVKQDVVEQIKEEFTLMYDSFRTREIKSIFGAPEISDEEYLEVQKKIQSGQQITEAEANSHRKKFCRDIYKYYDELDPESHAKFFENKEVRKFLNRCNFHISAEDIELYLMEIEKMRRTDENGFYLETNLPVEIVGGAPFNGTILKAGEEKIQEEKKIHLIEKYMVADYAERAGEFNLMAVDNSDSRFTMMLVSILHLLGFTLNGGCDVISPNIPAAKLRITRNWTFFNQYCGGRKYSPEIVNNMTDREFIKWLNYSLRAKFGLSINQKKKSGLWIKRYDYNPFPLYSKNNILGKTQATNDEL